MKSLKLPNILSTQQKEHKNGDNTNNLQGKRSGDSHTIDTVTSHITS